MFDTAMPLNGSVGLSGKCEYSQWTPPTKPPVPKEKLKERLLRKCKSFFVEAWGFDEKQTPESKYSLTLTDYECDPNYCDNYYEQEFTYYISDPGKVVARVVAEGNDYGEFSDEDWNDIKRVTRWLIDGDGEITTCAGTFRKLKGEQK